MSAHFVSFRPSQKCESSEPQQQWKTWKELTATKIAGRNINVRAAMVRMSALSRRVSLAISFESSAIIRMIPLSCCCDCAIWRIPPAVSIAMRLSRWFTRLYIWMWSDISISHAIRSTAQVGRRTHRMQLNFDLPYQGDCSCLQAGK